MFDVLEHLAEKRNFASKGVQGWNENAPARRPKIVDVKQDGKVVATGRQLMLVHTASPITSIANTPATARSR